MIRPYVPADKEPVLELFRQNVPRFFAPSEEADFLHYLEHEREHYFVVEVIGKIVGAGGFNLQDNGKRAHISWDFFNPQFQGKGLGRALTKFRIAEINKLPGVEKIVVRTSQAAFGFYQKLGFELKDIVKDYWATGFDLYEMELPKIT